MNNQIEAGEELRKNLLAIETIIWLPGCWAIIPEDLVEIIEDGDNRELLKAAGIPLKALKRYEKAKRIDRQDFGDYEIGEPELTGYLVKVGTPVPDETKIGDEGIPEHGMYTWGWSNWKWFYVKNLEDIVKPAVDWKRGLCAAKHLKNKLI